MYNSHTDVKLEGNSIDKTSTNVCRSLWIIDFCDWKIQGQDCCTQIGMNMIFFYVWMTENLKPL